MAEKGKNRHLVLGTAGHIDHGKSTLIQALTGTDPDRLAEEKRRGITIELGFAELPLPDGTTMGVVDVPGHERFVRQMISGATGIDLALVCIAADDGIMPQTREHLAVLELLGVTDCVIALTKCDLVDAEWIELVSGEIADELEGTPFQNAPLVPVSARTGEGLDTLLATLAERAAKVEETTKTGSVRLPIDRVFTIKGAGTVITGTLWQGTVKPGDELEVLPSGLVARVRTVQVHDQEVPQSVAGNRTALNLAGLKTTDVQPGDFLATPGTLEATNRFDARFTYLPTMPLERPLESGARVHVSHGTREVTGRLLFMDGKAQINPHDTVYAQVRLDAALPVSHGDRFIVRSFSPVHVIGGGTVLNSQPRHRTNLDDADRALLEALAKSNKLAMCHAAIDADTVPVSVEEIGRIAGLTPSKVKDLLCKEGASSKKPAYVHIGEGAQYWAKPATVQKHVMTMENLLLKFHAQNPEATGLAKASLQQQYPRHLTEGSFEALFAQAVDSGKLVFAKGEVSHPKAGAGARNLENQTAETLLSALKEQGAMPAPLDAVFEEAGLTKAQGNKAVLVLEERGQAQRIDRTFCFAAEALDQLQAALVSYLQENGSATAAELKTAMGTSRKYAIPLLEYFDGKKVTKREGDKRVLFAS